MCSPKSKSLEIAKSRNHLAHRGRKKQLLLYLTVVAWAFATLAILKTYVASSKNEVALRKDRDVQLFD